MNPDLCVMLAVAVVAAVLLISILCLVCLLTSVRRKLWHTELNNCAWKNENQILRRQIEEDRIADRARRGDHGKVYEGSYRELRKCRKTGRWSTVREVEVNP